LMKHPGTTLGKIIRSFKARSARSNHEAGHKSFEWQRNYYDHIIRDDIDHYFVEQYIGLNPIMWGLDAENPQTRKMPIETLREILQNEHGLDGFTLEKAIEYEMSYRSRSWK